LKIKRARFHQSGTLPKHGFLPIEKPLLLASYKVAFLCATNNKPHTEAEELVKPCAMEMAKTVLVTEAETKLSLVPLSDDIIGSRIRDMSEDILQQVIADIKSSPIKVSLQLDESTGVSSYSQLLVFVRYVKEKEVEEEFLFCEPLTTTTKAIDVFNIVKEFFLNHEMLQGLGQSFQGYCHHAEVSVSQGWMQDPFIFNLHSMDDNDQMKDDLIKMKASSKIKMEFDSMQLDAFWCAQLNTFPQLAKKALEILVPFATTYLCETEFSTLVNIKTKQRNRLDPRDDMRVSISKREPRFNMIIDEKQQQKSH